MNDNQQPAKAAAVGSEAIMERELRLLEYRKLRAEQLITDPVKRQRFLAALEA